MPTETVAAPSSHAIRNTALQWAVVWLIPGIAVMSGQGKSHAMTVSDPRPVMVVISALAGAFFGLLFANVRRHLPAPHGWRREPGERHSWRSRVGALGQSALLGVLVAGLLFRTWSVALGFGVLMGISAFIVPGNADLADR